MQEEIVKQRKIYFIMIDEVVNLTGYRKQEVHEICKNEILKHIAYEGSKIKTTKDIKSEDVWKNYIRNCKDYWYEKLDIII